MSTGYTLVCLRTCVWLGEALLRNDRQSIYFVEKKIKNKKQMERTAVAAGSAQHTFRL